MVLVMPLREGGKLQLRIDKARWITYYNPKGTSGNNQRATLDSL